MTDNHDNHDDNPDDLVQVFITTPIRKAAGDPFGLERLFLSWAWEGRFHDWEKALRSLARTLRGLEQLGLIERRTIRRPNDGTHHGFVLTDEGRAALAALAGDWIAEVDGE